MTSWLRHPVERADAPASGARLSKHVGRASFGVPPQNRGEDPTTTEAVPLPPGTRYFVAGSCGLLHGPRRCATGCHRLAEARCARAYRGACQQLDVVGVANGDDRGFDALLGVGALLPFARVDLPESLVRAFAVTGGQPWLVNALANQLVTKVVPDRAESIEVAHVDRAVEILIERQDTHLDSLAERLREKRVLEPILAGRVMADMPCDDVRYAIDLGLVCRSPLGGLEIANPIYAEVIPTELAFVTSASLPQIQPTWLTGDGRLDSDALREAFLTFWRQHGEPLLGTTSYHEIAPHLVLMSFLHRVVNGGGTLEREYAIGRGRMDLCLRLGPDVLAMELKVWRDQKPDPASSTGGALGQLDAYLAGLGLDSGWLVVFDQRTGIAPAGERTTSESATTPAGRVVTVVRA